MEIILILNKYKDILKDLVDCSDIEYLVILRQINLPNINIPDFKNDPSNPKINYDFSDRSQGQQQCRITPSPIFGPKSDLAKVKRVKKKRNNKEY